MKSACWIPAAAALAVTLAGCGKQPSESEESSPPGQRERNAASDERTLPPSESASGDAAPTERRPSAGDPPQPSTPNSSAVQGEPEPMPRDPSAPQSPEPGADDGPSVGLELNDPGPSPHDDLVPRPDFRLTAEEFYREVDGDEEAAERKYKGKSVRVSGVVEDFGRNAAGEAMIILKVPDELLGMVCFTNLNEPWAVLSPGQEVTVQGSWPPLVVHPTLVYCAIVEKGENPAVVTSPEELARQFAEDAETHYEKLDEKWLILAGKIADKETNEVGAVSVFLETPNDIKIDCSFTAFEKEQTEPLEIGQRLKLIGKLYYFDEDEQEISVAFCQLITGKQSGSQRGPARAAPAAAPQVEVEVAP